LFIIHNHKYSEGFRFIVVIDYSWRLFTKIILTMFEVVVEKKSTFII